MPGAACNPWVAMDVTTDPVVRSRLLRGVHAREFAGEARSSPDVREVVRESWRRSLAAGVYPDQGGAQIRLMPSEVEEARARSPLGPAISEMLSKLSSLDEDARQIVAIADADANLLWVTGDCAFRRARRGRRATSGRTLSALRWRLIMLSRSSLRST